MSIKAFRKIKIMDMKYIGPLQMDGPILTPMNVSESIAYNLVRSLYKVREVGPDKQEILLTTHNFFDENRFAPKTEMTKISNAPKTTPVTHKVADESKEESKDTTEEKPAIKAYVHYPYKTAIEQQSVVDETPVVNTINEADTSNGKRIEIDNVKAVPESAPVVKDTSGNPITGAMPSLINIPTSANTVEEETTTDTDDEEFEDEEDEVGEESTDSSSDSPADSNNPSKKKNKRRRKKH